MSRPISKSAAYVALVSALPWYTPGAVKAWGLYAALLEIAPNLYPTHTRDCWNVGCFAMPKTRSQIPKTGDRRPTAKSSLHRPDVCYRLPMVNGRSTHYPLPLVQRWSNNTLVDQTFSAWASAFFDTPADSKLAISRNMAQADCNNGQANAPPEPSPKRKPKSSSACTPRCRNMNS